MMNIPAPTLSLPREEWPDADFDIPEGQALHSAKDGDEDEDWDLEMSLGQTGGAKAAAVVAGITKRKMSSQMITIRPPIDTSSDLDLEDEDEDEGVSTIKVACLPKPQPMASPSPSTIDEDFELAFALPSELTQLSLAPLSLNHRASKNSLEWGDKDHTYSSQSSDAYSTLGFADASPSSNSTSSVPDTETEDEGSDDELDGLVIPSGLFGSGQSTTKLNKLLESKRMTQAPHPRSSRASLDPEDNFEIGLVIDDDVDLSPSRLLHNHQQQSSRLLNQRSNSLPPRPPASIRPPSRLKERAKSPINPPISSTRQFQKLRLSPSPPLRPPPSRSQTFQALGTNPGPSPSSPSFLSPKPGSLRGQKSHSGLKPPTPPSTQRKITRKASLSSLVEANTSQASSSKALARYEEPTAASRAKAHKNSTSRISAPEFKVPPTRPSTPSSSTAALRLTMPTTIRHKSRPALSAVFTAHGAQASSPTTASPSRSTSPLPPRPRSNLSTRIPTKVTTYPTPPVAPKVLRRPKRQRLYGDGTELDGIDDLPTDREKEGRFRVQPKGYGNRVPGGTYAPRSSLDKSSSDKGTIRKSSRREGSSEGTAAFAPSTNTLKRTGRIEFPKVPGTETLTTKKKKSSASSPGQSRRKPTLIRNLGGTGAPKVVGDMKWNPNALRWEGNDHVLRDFDAAVGTSTRPALITHLTGSSIGSPIGSFASGARIVGTMIFDPARMCWVSTLPPEEDEPDVFANLADDEEEDAWETKGGTIRALHQLGTLEGASANSSLSTQPGTEAPSPARSHTRTISESGSERGSRASMVYDVDHDFYAACTAAEERHRAEMKGWKSALARQATDVFAQPDRSNLYEIRALATRKY